MLPVRIRQEAQRLSETLDPDEKPDPMFEYFIGEPLRCARDLRDQLGLDETNYLRVAGQALADPRAHVLYTALDEVQKTSIWLIRSMEQIQGEVVDPSKGAIERLTHVFFLEDRDARIRRLLEVLVTLVLFGQSNDQPYYRHLLALEHLDSLLSQQQDAREFWDAPTNNLAWSIKSQVAFIESCEREVELAACWYLKQSEPIARTRLAAGQLLSSMRSRLKLALPRMRDREALLFGHSYASAYGRTSESMHYSPENRDIFAFRDSPASGVGHLGLLCFEIVIRCHELLGSPPLPRLTKVSELLERTDGNEAGSRVRARSVKVGDFVLASGALTVVVEERSSRYGYVSFRVRYLAEKPLPDVDDEWFPTYYLRPFYTREKFLDGLRQMKADGTLPPDLADRMIALPPDELLALLTDSIGMVWNDGLGAWVRAEAAKRRRTGSV
jgi:hypothetical protein